VVLLFGVIASAQVKPGSLAGRVIDQSGAIVADVSVILIRERDGAQLAAISDENGGFRFQSLEPGRYLIEAASAGFSFAQKSVELANGDSLNTDLMLSPAPIAERIAVVASHIAGGIELWRRTPGSAETLDHYTLQTSRVFNSSEALRKIAGLHVRDEEGFGLRPNIGIRGLNPSRSTKVLLLEDGIPLAYAPYGDNASYYHPPIDRFESIEVLKGSGQILYGPVTVGGVINYITPNPPDRPAGSILLVGGTRDYFNGHLNYGGTWGRTGLLFDYMRKQGEGARDNVRSGLNDFNFKSLTALGSRQALTVRANYYGEDSNITYSGLREDEYAVNPRQNPFRNDFFYGARYGASATHAYTFENDVILTTNLYWSSFHRDWWRQSSNSGQRPNDSADSACGGMVNLNTTCGNEGRLRDYNTWGIEPRLRINHRLNRLTNETDLGIRAHYEIQNREQRNGQRPNSRTGVLVEDNERRNRAYSAFAQNRFIVGDWTLTPGLRLERIRYERTNRLAMSGLGVTGRTSLTQLVPGIGFSYNAATTLTLFGGLHRGFAPPRTEDIINNTTGGTVELDPELSWNYEVGVRTSPRRGLSLDATLFRMDYENQVVPASLAGGVGATLTNGGETLHQGAEVTARVDLGTLLRSARNIFFRAAYTYTPTAKFTGARFSSVAGFSGVSVSGNRLPYAPARLLNASLGYSNSSGFAAMLEAVHTSSQFGDDLNTVRPTPDGQRGLIRGYTLCNATVNYRLEAMRTTLFITAKNVFDRTVIVDRARGILPSSPRLIQVGLKLAF
jgi:Fe(3+) dicitrate transport protein